MKGSSFLLIFLSVLLVLDVTNCQLFKPWFNMPVADHGGLKNIKEVVDESIQAMYFRDTPKNYDQKSLYRKTSPTSKKIALHNRIFKKAVADAIRAFGIDRDEAFTMVQNEMLNLFGQDNRPKPGGFPGGHNGQGINNGVSIPFLPPLECNDGVEISCSASKYYSIDGTCNNLRNPRWGSTNSALRRFLPAEYEGDDEPKVTGLPNPRTISTKVHKDLDKPYASVSHMVMQWGQFLDHDITLTPENDVECECGHAEENDDDCFLIPVPSNDPFYSTLASPPTCLHFTRSTAFCTSNPREQFNLITSYIDGSNVYGSDQTTSDLLREFSGGELTTSVALDNMLPDIDGARVAGDVRAQEQPGLTSIHTLWMREHNRVAKEMAEANPSFSDEQLFQESRRMVAAQLQNIVYDEWLPKILGSSLIDRYGLTVDQRNTRYDDSLDSSIINSFATAAFRFGHSLIQGVVDMVSQNGRTSSTYNLRNNFFNTSLYLSEDGVGMEELLNGLTRQAAQTCDRYATEELTNFLFKEENDDWGSDLMARNIQRGRDHGLPGYNEFRKMCGLSSLTRSKPEEISTKNWRLLRSAYDNVNEIDLISGGLAESSVSGGLVGSTFGCIIGEQFKRLMYGDRLFFTHSGVLSNTEFQKIKSRDLRNVLCDNTDVEGFQQDVFTTSSKIVSCRQTVPIPTPAPVPVPVPAPVPSPPTGGKGKGKGKGNGGKNTGGKNTGGKNTGGKNTGGKNSGGKNTGKGKGGKVGKSGKGGKGGKG